MGVLQSIAEKFGGIKEEMIDFIEGKLSYIENDSIVIEAQGLGYRIFMGNPYQYQEKKNQTVRVFTHYYVREDAIFLYGFQHREERNVFRQLLNVSGIGPKGAMAIISAASPVWIIQAVQREDVDFLVRFPGIGKKTAQRMILDLKDKWKTDIDLSNLEEITDVNAPVQDLFQTFAQPKQEATEALLALGYSENEVKKIMVKIEKEGADLQSTDQIIKRALQLFLTM